MKKIIVAGCLTERYKNELKDEMPEIDAMVGVGSFGEIVDVLNAVMASDEPVYTFGNIDAPIDETGRILSTGPSWAYIKIAEGCDNFCSYCIIPKLRGRFRSRPQENILAEAQALAHAGVKELIVVAQDITRYGIDLYGERTLSFSNSALGN
ncbi:MAG: radical SAM protein [Odoribacter sp.]